MGHDEQIQAALDGELGETEASRLARILESQPDARRLYASLKQVDAGLRKLGVAEPPPELRDGVMRQIRLRQAVAQASGEARSAHLRSWWQGWFSARPVFQMGLGFALGVLVLWPLVRPSQVTMDPASVAGTLVPSNPVGAKETRLRIEGPGLSGALVHSQVGHDLTLRLHLNSLQPVLAELDFNHSMQRLSSIVTDGSPTTKLEYTSTGFTVLSEGDCSYTISLASGSAGAVMHLRVTSNGTTLFEADVP
jgi:anti-sigma factor RsiW